MANQKRLISRFSRSAPKLAGRAWEDARAELQKWLERVVSILDAGGTQVDLDAHNDLNEIQGGSEDERYHFTLPQHSYLAAHQSAVDPHPQYTTAAEAAAAAAAAVAAHEAAGDPHPQYTTAAEAQAIADDRSQAKRWAFFMSGGA